MDIEIKKTADVIIVGSGASGLFAALSLAPKPVMVLSEKPLGGICASCWAQGGIAAAVDKQDSAFSHTKDTIKAAAGTANAEVVRVLTEEAPAYMKILEKMGVQFDYDEEGNFKLSREACHTRRRVLKATTGDGFGFELMRALVEEVRRTPSITFVEGVTAERVIRQESGRMGAVQGILARHIKTGKQIAFQAPAVVLATGGIGGLYEATTNPLHALGRGVAMAARAGAVLSDLEFVQFHPTALDIGEDPAPLATEALRGEGAYLVNSRGHRFMLEEHEMGELAPRDVVSRSIFIQMQKGQRVYLDCRHIDVAHFPALIEASGRAGLNPQHDLIPVMPVVHYHMGGISTDLNGRTSLHGLWAIGEVAATGLHGANRLASNSLMEAVVMGGRTAEDIKKAHFSKTLVKIKSLPVIHQKQIMTKDRLMLRHLMTDLVGVVRDKQSLKEALQQITAIAKKAKTKDAKLFDMALVAQAITVSALQRRESRGGHCRADYPKTKKEWQKRTFITQKEIEIETANILAPEIKTIREEEFVA